MNNSIKFCFSRITTGM
ncbi:TPA: hypothetical protein MOX26_004184 [Salmonella enterica subsp. enterica serovar Ball]|uniref:Peptide IlvX n=2 Tax=Salmonella enterica TaxID=28901 RepID=A0A8F7YN13_SALER|nr:peptide IlvX [Salmonella enterica]EHJ5092051.1 hypothetical protein [Salmonella enterica subsp. salamae serovar 16:m,t:-]EHM1752299.1 hypothetical protein [Salmonella enterica subsp. salamae serovar 40:c:e,n,x,z15]EIR0426145.1 hypothetical protein [Salmonella enterica subsp. enterica serovar London]EJU7773227.1 hypothetical protein [Salmonella enterica subsp. salamae serovar 4,12:e,n,x:1,6]EKR1461127.1 hypothetical protein [Salmonella enterica subsp. salamae serovar 47:b:1,5]EKR2077241.1 h